MTSLHWLELILLLMAAAVVLAVAARHLEMPPAVAFLLGGTVLAVIPGVRSVDLDPDLILALFLPPLLQSSAFNTNWRDLRANLGPILLLAVGAVGFTTAVVAAVAHLLLPGLPWAACFTLGAIVAPPDAVAASAVLQRLRLPRRMVSVLEGESLLNDASGLMLYRFAVGAMIGGTFDAASAAGSFVLLAAGGLAAGLAVGTGTLWLMRKLHDTHLEIASGFLAAWTSYFLAEGAHLSGVLAVVACGLLLGVRHRTLVRPQTRLEARATWSFVIFVLEALVFILVGLSLQGVLARLGWVQAVQILLPAGCITASVVVARVLWVFPAAYLPNMLRPRPHRSQAPRWAVPAVVAWAGMRGVVSIALALALPAGFPGRDGILLTAFIVVFATVLVQGTTLGPLIRLLGLVAPDADAVRAAENARVRALVASAALALVERRSQDALDGAIARDLLQDYRDQLSRVHLLPEGGPAQAERLARLGLRLDALAAGRTVLHALHRERGADEAILHAVEHDLDVEESRLRRRLG